MISLRVADPAVSPATDLTKQVAAGFDTGGGGPGNMPSPPPIRQVPCSEPASPPVEGLGGAITLIRRQIDVRSRAKKPLNFLVI